jgi:transcriptional regulator with XRE-family HTH domain
VVVKHLEQGSLRNFLTTKRGARILEDMKPLPEMLEEWRGSLKLSKAEAARRCQMSQVQWSELTTGVTRDPRTSTLIKLADGTGFPLERLAAAAELNLVPA